MHLCNLPIPGAYLLQLDVQHDERGSFCRLFCEEALSTLFPAPSFPQVSLSTSTHKGTLRGLHYQASPYLEAKLVYCLAGSLFDVIVDLRKDSPCYLHHFSYQLSSNAQEALYIPKGCAHGFLTCMENTHLLYFLSEKYRKEHARGYRYDEEAFGIVWPFAPTVVSKKDQNFPPFVEDHAPSSL